MADCFCESFGVVMLGFRESAPVILHPTFGDVYFIAGRVAAVAQESQLAACVLQVGVTL